MTCELQDMKPHEVDLHGLFVVEAKSKVEMVLMTAGMEDRAPFRFIVGLWVYVPLRSLLTQSRQRTRQ